MKGRAVRAAERMAGALEAWPEVCCVALGEPIAEDFYDPYYFVSIDVYYTGSLPPAESRYESFSFGGAFESSYSNRKDRLIYDRIPIRLEYKEMKGMEDLIEGRGGLQESLREGGTYGFYRIINSDILFSRCDWLPQMRKKLEDMPQSFWDLLRRKFQARMEHFLGDLGGAVMRRDDLFFIIAAAGFVRSTCAVLFAINRRFEPSPRLLAEQVMTLPILPDTFEGRFGSFLRNDSGLSPGKKREVAELLVKNILNL